MPTQHSAITDANRHENKGASTALSGQVLKGNGDGTTSFVNPNTLANISISSTIEGQSLVSQGPSAVDTPYQVTWGSGSSNSDVNIASNGIVTILTAGLYNINFNLTYGRSNASGIAILFARLLLNSSPIGFVQSAKIDTSINVQSSNSSILRSFAANDTLVVQLIRDSSGANDGGLVSLDPVLALWANNPSAAIRVQKLAGAV